MVVTVFHRMEGEPEAAVSKFSDIPADTWFSKSVAWAAADEIVNGYSEDKFGPSDDVTREQIATILFRYADKKGYDVSGRADLSGYSDKDTVSDWAKDAAAYCYENGILTDSGAIRPTETIGRGEIAQMIFNMLKLAGKI